MLNGLLWLLPGSPSRQHALPKFAISTVAKVDQISSFFTSDGEDHILLAVRTAPGTIHSSM
jgi:hypothetical protein